VALASGRGNRQRRRQCLALIPATLTLLASGLGPTCPSCAGKQHASRSLTARQALISAVAPASHPGSLRVGVLRRTVLPPFGSGVITPLLFAIGPRRSAAALASPTTRTLGSRRRPISQRSFLYGHPDTTASPESARIGEFNHSSRRSEHESHQLALAFKLVPLPDTQGLDDNPAPSAFTLATSGANFPLVGRALRGQ